MNSRLNTENRNEKAVVKLYISCFSPESSGKLNLFWQVFWLVPAYRLPISCFMKQWHADNHLIELTATGIAPDFHGIPF